MRVSEGGGAAAEAAAAQQLRLMGDRRREEERSRRFRAALLDRQGQLLAGEQGTLSAWDGEDAAASNNYFGANYSGDDGDGAGGSGFSAGVSGVSGVGGGPMADEGAGAMATAVQRQTEVDAARDLEQMQERLDAFEGQRRRMMSAAKGQRRRRQAKAAEMERLAAHG